MQRFSQQVVIVTGGTRGIGGAITKSFLEEGATVIATFNSNQSAADEFVRLNSFAQERLIIKSFDVANARAVDDFYFWFDQTFSRLDVLVNNSGVRKDSICATLSEDHWDQVLDTNLKGTFLMSKGAVVRMSGRRYGRIINISSIGATLGLPGQANYAASKAGQIAMAKSLAKEVGKRNITVNSVCPGFIETELLSDLPEDQVKEYQKQVPLKRFGTAAEVAFAVKFLASSEAAYITGSELNVTGGL